MISATGLDLVPLAVWTLVSVHAAIVLFVAAGLARLRRSRAVPAERLPEVTVIVSARNEEVDLPRCIRGLAALDYPTDRLQILLVDDGSTDRTPEIIADAAKRYPHVRGLSTRDVPAGALQAKARGVARGAREATGEWIFITDADALMAPGWIRHMLSEAGPDVGIIGGMMVGRGGGFVATLERASWAATLPFAFGLAGWGITWVCVGPNMAIRRAIYEAAGGLQAATFTIAEDIALFRMVERAGYRALGHATPETTVRMTPVPTFRHFLSQQRRWLRGGFEGGMAYGVGLIGMFGFQFLLSVSLLAGLLVAPRAALVAWGVKAAADTIMLVVESWRVRQPIWRLSLFMVPFSVGTFLWMPISFLWSRTVHWLGDGYAVTYRLEDEGEPVVDA